MPHDVYVYVHIVQFLFMSWDWDGLAFLEPTEDYGKPELKAKGEERVAGFK